MNYEKLIKFHIRSKNDLTIVVSKQKTKIPYGVCKIDNNNELINIEKSLNLIILHRPLCL